MVQRKWGLQRQIFIVRGHIFIWNFLLFLCEELNPGVFPYALDTSCIVVKISRKTRGLRNIQKSLTNVPPILAQERTKFRNIFVYLFCPPWAAVDKQKDFIFTSFTEDESWGLLFLNECWDGSWVPWSCYCMLFVELSRTMFIIIKTLALNAIKLLISTLPNKNPVASISQHCKFPASVLTSSHQKEEALEPLIKVTLLLPTKIRCLILQRQHFFLIWHLFHLL